MKKLEVDTKDKEDDTKDKEDDTKDKEDDTKDKEDDTKDKEDDTKDKEDDTKDKEDDTKDKEDDTKGANISPGMGPYDGLCLQTEYEDPPYIDSDTMIPQGHTMPVTDIKPDYKYLEGPPIDGKGDVRGLYMYSRNHASPECCMISNISTSNGCICPTREQIKYINSRGGNN